MMSNDLKNLLGKARRGTVDLTDALDDVRRQIIMAEGDRVEIDNAPISQDEALARVAEWAKSFRSAETISDMARRFTRPVFRAPIHQDMLAIALFAVTDQIASSMKERVLASYDGAPKPLSAEDRKAALQAISDRLLGLELAEESIIRVADASGLDCLRRGDADPRAVLARQEDLP